MRKLAVLVGAAVAAWGFWGCEEHELPAQRRASTVSAKPKPKQFPKLTCAADSPKTEAGGKVLGCVVAKDTKIGPIICLAKARLDLYADGKLKECTLAKAHAYNGVPCVAAKLGRWYRSGKLQRCGLDVLYERSGVKCRGEIELHENGKLRRCPVATTVKLGEVEIPAASQITLAVDGKVAQVKRPADDPYRYENIDCSAVHYYPSGKVRICVTGDKAKVDGKELPADSKLCFEEDGTPATKLDEGCVERKILPPKG